MLLCVQVAAVKAAPNMLFFPLIKTLPHLRVCY